MSKPSELIVAFERGSAASSTLMSVSPDLLRSDERSYYLPALRASRFVPRKLSCQSTHLTFFSFAQEAQEGARAKTGRFRTTGGFTRRKQESVNAKVLGNDKP